MPWRSLRQPSALMPTLTFDIRNTGTADLQVHSLELVGLNKTGYSLVSPPAVPFTVAPLTGRTITVRLTPAASQSYDYAKLAVGSDDPDEPVVELALDGAAAGAAVAEGIATSSRTAVGSGREPD